jgi:hypothetical protein
MEVMFDRVAGLDVGKESVTVCVRTPGSRRGRHSETRTFKTMTGSLRVMRDWLVESGVTIAAMESTSAYWKPPFYCLDWVGRRDRREPPVEHGRYITCGSEVAIGGDCLQVAERVLAGFGRQVEEVCSQGWPGGFGGESGNVVVGWSSSATVWGSTSCSAATWGPEALDIVSR